MAKRTQRKVVEASQHWYQDKYQHVLTQRNMLALVALVALSVALMAVFAVMRLAPLKTLEPYLLQIDERTGITQRVNPVTREVYTANEAVDKYFTALYLRMREGFNPSIVRFNSEHVRLMSDPKVYAQYYPKIDSRNPESLTILLGKAGGARDVYVRDMAYIRNPLRQNEKPDPHPIKIIQSHITTVDRVPNQSDIVQGWTVTLTFDYVALDINEDERLINPLGYQVTSYQIEPELKR